MFEVYAVWLPPLLGTPILPLVTALKPLSGSRFLGAARHCAYAETL
jgi:hypothetical protein